MKIVPTPKEPQLIELIERFEMECGIPNTAIFNTDGLLVTHGFQKQYISPDILGAQGARVFATILKGVDEILAKPPLDARHTRLLKEVGHIPRREVIVDDVLIETRIETLDYVTLTKRLTPVKILITPIKTVGFLVILIDRGDTARIPFIKRKARRLKQQVRQILT